MSLVTIKMPPLGKTYTEAIITKWHVKEGDTISEDQLFFDITTDKVESEIAAEKKGVVKKLYYQEGDKVSIGDVVAEIEV